MLGIRGQVSELERDGAVHRMVEARWNKARRGEAFTIPPAGYELDELGQIQLSSDEAVQNAVKMVFEKFDELGAARQVYLWWRAEGLPFPVRRMVPRTRCKLRIDQAAMWARAGDDLAIERTERNALAACEPHIERVGAA